MSTSNFSLRTIEQSLQKTNKHTKQEIQKIINSAQEEDLELSRATALTVFKEVFDNYYGDNYDIDCLPYLLNFTKNKNTLAETQFVTDSTKFRFSDKKQERNFNKNESGFSPLSIFRKRSSEYKSTFFVEGESINKDFTEQSELNEDNNQFTSYEKDKYEILSDDSSDSTRQYVFSKINIDASNLTKMNNPDIIGGNSINDIIKIATTRTNQELVKIHKQVRNKYGF